MGFNDLTRCAYDSLFFCKLVVFEERTHGVSTHIHSCNWLFDLYFERSSKGTDSSKDMKPFDKKSNDNFILNSKEIINISFDIIQRTEKKDFEKMTSLLIKWRYLNV